MRLITLLVLLNISFVLSTKRLLLSSGYGDQLGFIELETSSGKATFIKNQIVDANLTFITQFDEENFFAGHQVLTPIEGLEGEGGISRWTLNRDELSIERQQLVAAGGYDPAYLSYTPDVLFGANYWGPTFVAFNMDPNSLELDAKPFFSESWEGEPGSGVYPGWQQESSHPHCALFYEKNGQKSIYVSDLGRDKIVVYGLNGKNNVEFMNEYETTPGFGPRHLIVDNFGQKLIVVGELKTEMIVYNILSDHQLELAQALEYNVETPSETKIKSKEEDGENLQFGAEIVAYSNKDNKQFVYVSQRDYGAIMTFELDDELTLLEQTNIKGQWPRDFTIVEDEIHGALLVTVSEFEDLMEVWRIDEQSGSITKTDEIKIQATPTCVLEAKL